MSDEWIPNPDDLLPSNDGCYEPPADLNELFTHGSPLFEPDVWKHDLSEMTGEEKLAFRLGWEAHELDMCLKAGKPFCLTIRHENVERLTKRAEGFRRTVEVKTFTEQLVFFTVSEHTPA